MPLRAEMFQAERHLVARAVSVLDGDVVLTYSPSLLDFEVLPVHWLVAMC